MDNNLYIVIHKINGYVKDYDEIRYLVLIFYDEKYGKIYLIKLSILQS